MFYYLHQLAGEGFGFLAVFKAVTFRAAFAALFAFVVCVTLGPHVIAFLRRKKFGENTTKSDSEFIAQKHAVKSGTPTMGGVILVGSTLFAVALFARCDVVFVPLAFFTMLALALVGFYDDWIKLTRAKEKGLTIKEKLVLQALIGLGVGFLLYEYGPSAQRGVVAIPFVDAALYPALGYAYLLWAGVVLTASSNAVNLTDGLDGLATLCTITVAVAFGLMAYFAGHATMAHHLAVPRVAGAEELAVICAALAGACLGFLWFNAHPAEVFMGDTGSLALGGLVGLVSLSIKQELMLVLVGGVFVIEALSVLIQIASFRWFGRRVFRIAPLHHHFEKVGWPETKIVSRFFIVSVLLAVFSIATLRV
ncbi:MAG: phospho-N-acetylmuramoyl-pentapeptide-transferase [Planctomycetota bacterium]|nr:phospho-N-acetylmuramoyl-pentapeptide-transferase [Planctomycetota bacterium]